MSFSDELRSLARLPRSAHPFLSVYLNTRWDSEKQRERVRIFVKTRLKEVMAAHESTNGKARQSLEQDVARIERYVKGLVNREWDEGVSGVALFACAGLDVYSVLRSHFPFEEAFHCSDRPILRPAALQSGAAERVVLALVGGNACRLLELELGRVRRDFQFRDEEFPGRHEQGGWSQARYQRHVDEHLSRNLKSVSEQLVKWVDEGGIRRLFLAGPEADLSVFEQRLPKRAAQLVAARLRLDPNAPVDAMRDEVDRALAEVRSAEDAKALDALFDRALGAGRAVAGAEPVSQAVSAGRVRELFLEKGYHDMGWKCFSCNQLGVKVPLGCPSCGSPVETVEVGEEVVRATVAADGVVVVVHEHAALRAAGGLAALVRYG